MEFTINCTRVPIPHETRLYGIPVDEVLVPALQGLVSNHVAPLRASDDDDVLNLHGRVSPNRKEAAPDPTKLPKHFGCRNFTIFSTFNAHTPGPLDRLEELVANAQ